MFLTVAAIRRGRGGNGGRRADVQLTVHILNYKQTCQLYIILVFLVDIDNEKISQAPVAVLASAVYVHLTQDARANRVTT